jgi:hypothetical protein
LPAILSQRSSPVRSVGIFDRFRAIFSSGLPTSA